MSDEALSRLALKLKVSPEEAQALWKACGEVAFECLREGIAVDLGYAYLRPVLRQERRTWDINAGSPAVVPAHTSIKCEVPPHSKAALSCREDLSEYVWLTRRQLKALPASEWLALDARNLTYYRLTGVSR